MKTGHLRRDLSRSFGRPYVFIVDQSKFCLRLVILEPIQSYLPKDDESTSPGYRKVSTPSMLN